MSEVKRRGRPPKAPAVEPLAELVVEVKKPRNLTREAIAPECGEERAREMIPE
jgi:hypothetical protein